MYFDNLIFKGTLHETSDGWVVKSHMPFEDQYLHILPVDLESFDINSKQSIIVLKENKEVEFKIKKVFLSDKITWSAKLIEKTNDEISDEEIEKAAKECVYEDLDISVGSFELGARWYREQIKKRK